MASEAGTIVLTRTMSALFDDLVEQFAKKTGEGASDVRRAVELSVLSRGLQSLQAELGHDSETVGALPELEAVAGE